MRYMILTEGIFAGLLPLDRGATVLPRSAKRALGVSSDNGGGCLAAADTTVRMKEPGSASLVTKVDVSRGSQRRSLSYPTVNWSATIAPDPLIGSARNSFQSKE
jgi:hypothetical protein